MKKVSVLLVVILLILDFSMVKAKTAQIEVTTNKKQVSIGDEFMVTVNTKNIEVAACTIRLYFDETKVEVISRPEESNIANGMLLYTWFDKQGGRNLKSDASLAEFTFRAKENGVSIFAIQGEFYNKEEQIIKPNIQPVEVKIGEETIRSNEPIQALQENEEENTNNSTNLKILRLNQEGISPDFQKDIKEYYITVGEEIENLEVTAIPESENSKVTITGNKNLKNGLNQILIKVINTNGKQDEYKIYITKTNNIDEANSNLENLAIENAVLEPTFEEGITNYEASVENKVEKLNILAIPQNPKATVSIAGANELKEGNNDITITVTAPNGITFKKYQIKVNRKSKTEVEQKEESQGANKQVVETIDNSKQIETKEKETRKEEAKNGWWIILGVIVGISIIGCIVIICLKRKK